MQKLLLLNIHYALIERHASGSVSAGRRIGVWGSKTAFRHGYNDQGVSAELMMLCKRRHADTPIRFPTGGVARSYHFYVHTCVVSEGSSLCLPKAEQSPIAPSNFGLR